MSASFDTDVLIVGAGPTGATTALALATYGVRVSAVSQWNWVANTPRAHVINQRANEVFRDLGVEDAILAAATGWDQVGDTSFATSLAGEEIARLRTWGTGPQRHSDYLTGSPSPVVDLGQPQAEAILVDAAASRGARFVFNTEYLGHTEDSEGVTVSLRDRDTDRTYALRARYLVGADGARSKIAEAIGLEIHGEHARQGQVYARFNADLSAYVEHRQAVLHYIVNPVAGFGELGLGVLRAVRPWDRWMAGWGFDKSLGEPDLDHDSALERIRALVGDPGLDAEIEWVAPWYVNQAYATDYARGRVFCGGDAVHRHPPSSGLGSNTCVQDAFNLAWKLAYVIRGWAGTSLLDTYSAERAPVGKQIVDRANLSRFEYAPLREALGADGTEAGLEAGLRNVARRTSEGARARSALRAAIELKNYEFNGQGVELNHRYASAAVFADPTDGEEVWQRDRELYHQATTRPGAKIPHTWLVDANGHRTSTLDVTGHGKITLVTGLSGVPWQEAVARIDAPWLDLVIIGARASRDLYGDWARLSEIDEGGAVLVRPDGVVAWRHAKPVENVDTATERLSGVLHRILDIAELPRTTAGDSVVDDQPRFVDPRKQTQGAAVR